MTGKQFRQELHDALDEAYLPAPWLSSDIRQALGSAPKRARLLPILAATVAIVVVVGLGAGAIAVWLTQKSQAGVPAGNPSTASIRRGFAPALSQVTFVDQLNGYGIAWGYQPPLLARTTDGGSSWELVGPMPEGGDVHFATPMDGFVTGGALAVTHDGGRTWRRPLGPSRQVFQVSTFGREVWALTEVTDQGGSAFELQLSTDEGDHWRRLGLSGIAPIRGLGGPLVFGNDQVVAVDSNTAYVQLEQHRFALTRDRGQTWTSVTTPCVEPVGEAFGAFSGGDLWLVCTGYPVGHSQEKTIYRSRDAGGHWVRTTNPPAAGQVRAAAFGDNLHAWLALDDGLIATSDGGETWKIAIPADAVNPATTSVSQILFVDPAHGFALTSWYLWATEDGVNWRRVG